MRNARAKHITGTRTICFTHPQRKGDVNQTVITSSSRNTVGCPIFSSFSCRDKHLNFIPDKCCIVLGANALLQSQEALIAFKSNILWHLILSVRCRSTGTRRVEESEGRTEARFFNNFESLLEVFFSLSRESNNDVRGNCCVGNCSAYSRKNSHETITAVGAAHLTQDGVRTRLKRHVQRRHDSGRFSHRLDYVISKSRWVWACKTNALQTVNLAYGSQQISESTTLTEANSVRVNVLSQKGNFNCTFINNCLHFFKNFTGTAIAFFSTKVRNDAEGAGVITAN